MTDIQIQSIDMEIVEKEKSRLWKLSEFYSLKANYIELLDKKIESGGYRTEQEIIFVREKEALGDAKEAEKFASQYFEQRHGIANLMILLENMAREQIEPEVK